MIDIIQFAFVLAAKFMVWVRPALPLICAAFAWLITGLLVLNIVSMARQGAANVRRMHRIPCAGCLYATESYRLKCSVRPVEAFSETAIGCQDFAVRVSAEVPLQTANGCGVHIPNC